MRKIHSKLNVFENCREEGIRTLDTLLAYTHFPGVRLRPLGHLSSFFFKRGQINKKMFTCESKTLLIFG